MEALKRVLFDGAKQLEGKNAAGAHTHIHILCVKVWRGVFNGATLRNILWRRGGTFFNSFHRHSSRANKK